MIIQSLSLVVGLFAPLDEDRLGVYPIFNAPYEANANNPCLKLYEQMDPLNGKYIETYNLRVKQEKTDACLAVSRENQAQFLYFVGTVNGAPYQLKLPVEKNKYDTISGDGGKTKVEIGRPRIIATDGLLRFDAWYKSSWSIDSPLTYEMRVKNLKTKEILVDLKISQFGSAIGIINEAGGTEEGLLPQGPRIYKNEITTADGAKWGRRDLVILDRPHYSRYGVPAIFEINANGSIQAFIYGATFDHPTPFRKRWHSSYDWINLTQLAHAPRFDPVRVFELSRAMVVADLPRDAAPLKCYLKERQKNGDWNSYTSSYGPYLPDKDVGVAPETPIIKPKDLRVITRDAQIPEFEGSILMKRNEDEFVLCPSKENDLSSK